MNETAQVFSKGINHRFAHEIAHSYFGYVVTGASSSEQWIDEAFSESLSAYAIEILKDKREAKSFLSMWKANAKQSSKAAPIFYANDLAWKVQRYVDETQSIDRSLLLYHKGAHLLATMRTELGDDPYFTVLKSFLRNFEKKRRHDRRLHLADKLRHQKDWKPFFEKYYYGTEMP
jgi:aminopeptidase N